MGQETPPLNQNQRIALAVSQLLIGIFIIFMAGTILHHYIPLPGASGVYFEGIFLGIVVVLHVKRVLAVYEETRGTEDE
jgi:hypothetical protein